MEVVVAKPRVFISSTYYDLKHLRSSIENFVDLLGYEALLSEKDNIAYVPDSPLDESCYREVQNSDIYVLIIGGRYGSETSSAREKSEGDKEFFERYESVTKLEYINAIERDIPTYVLVDSAVDAEYHTFQKNKENKDIQYAHVDSVNIFHFIEEIREKQKNNPIKLFTKYSDIEHWLREQWAGLLKELIDRMSRQQQLQDLNTKIVELSETSETLKVYLEEVVSKVSSEENGAMRLIEQENIRLREAKEEAEFMSFRYIRHLQSNHSLAIPTVKKAIYESDNYADFINKIFQHDIKPCAYSLAAFNEVNGARGYLDLERYSRKDLDALRIERDSSDAREGAAARRKKITTKKKATKKKATKKKATEKKATEKKATEKKG